METTISTWGNSEAIRLPQALLKVVKLTRGDKVTLNVNERGNIEISPAVQPHRQVAPKKGVSFASLFNGYDPQATPPSSAWPDDDMVGAEWEAWAR